MKKVLKKSVLEKEAAFWLNAKTGHAESQAKKCHK